MLSEAILWLTFLTPIGVVMVVVIIIAARQIDAAHRRG
jgi:hypothetical protein